MYLTQQLFKVVELSTSIELSIVPQFPYFMCTSMIAKASGVSFPGLWINLTLIQTA